MTPPAPPRTPMPPPELAVSPRIAELERDLASGAPDALPRFWAEVAGEGTPLVEPIAGDLDHRVVTFLWRDAGTRTSEVLLLANCVTDRSVLPQSRLTRIPGTDVWHRSYRMSGKWRGSYQFVALDEPFPDPPAVEDANSATTGHRMWRMLGLMAEPDPLNHRRLPARWGAPPRSVAELPDAPPQPWAAPRPGAPRGRVETHIVHSGHLGADRKVWAYLPPDHDPNVEYPILVLLDGDMWGDALPIQSTLDNLVAERRLPPLVAVMPDAVDNQTRWRDLGCHDPFLGFLRDDLLPWAARRWRVTDDPARTVIAGQSLGGLTALYAGLRAPERFGNLLAQSASVWWRPDGAGEPHWLAGQFAESAPLPLRIHLEVGTQEWILTPATRHLRNVLGDKGYDVSYAEHAGGHDYACWLGSLATGLITLTSGWA
ncbi:enterochelin esterase [Streptoalloteichus hindustanus]|uniref:Enterochelin esterase n=1 Tax=Streptoalloteichus hindustanus TaxID=2017 RepID=A0A1M5JT17_STRHI|nr:enterochelin esterase [Streptoalloteichus hindustanus]SHG43133.1 enterochelin esterase [Streptoalloteichus hindustanus]